MVGGCSSWLVAVLHRRMSGGRNEVSHGRARGPATHQGLAHEYDVSALPGVVEDVSRTTHT